jgi:hypothetical protein
MLRNPQATSSDIITGGAENERFRNPSALTWAWVVTIPAIFSGIVIVWLLLAAHTNMNVPVVCGRDALSEVAIFKGIGEGNLPWRNNRLAAPFGADWRDYPYYQWIDYSAFRFFSLFTTNYLKLLNWYWILTIMATAATAAYCLLRLRTAPLVAGCLAFLYAMQPFVFARNISHFDLICYLVPLLAVVCLEVAAGRWVTGKSSAVREIPMHGWMAFLLQGISFFYFSLFGALLLSAAAFYGACRRRTRRPLMHGTLLLLVLVLLGVSRLSVSPTLVHWVRHGTNPVAVERSAAQAEVHGLRIRHLLTPVPEHPLPFMRRLSEIVDAKHHDETEASTARLGLLGAILAALAGWRWPWTMEL